jgi:hypothetical protein
MKIKYIDGTLDVGIVSDIAEFLSEEGPKLLYLSLDGGSIGYASTIIDMINRTPQLTVVGSNRLYSAGLWIFSEIKVPKELSDRTRGMWHQGTLEVTMNTDGKMTYIADKFSMRRHKQDQDDIIMGLARKLSMTDKEIEKIMKGKDVYFTYERMKEMFKL